MGNNQSFLQSLFPLENPNEILAIYNDLVIDEDDYELLFDDNINAYDNEEQRKENSNQQRINWYQHVVQCRHDSSWNRKYRMSYEAFTNLVDLLRDDLSTDSRKSRYGGHISAEITVAIGIRWMSGVEYGALSDIYKCCKTQVYDARDEFFTAIIINDKLQIKIPDTAEEWEAVRKGFEQLSANQLFHGTCGAIDGFFQPTNKPLKSEVAGNVLAYFSGHYKSYGLNVQAACDSKLRFLYFGIVAPGKTNDNVAFRYAAELRKAIHSLPIGLYFVGDAAYDLHENLLVPFTGSQRENQNKDAYNFYLSQMRIRIEMAFGRLTNKWRRLRNKLDGKQENISVMLLACATLHNYIIDFDLTDLDDEEINENSNDFVVRNAPSGMSYLPNVPEALDKLDGTSQSQQSLLMRISSEEIRRPQHNLARNSQENSNQQNNPMVPDEYFHPT